MEQSLYINPAEKESTKAIFTPKAAEPFSPEKIDGIFQSQKEFFNTGKTRDIAFRKEQLNKFETLLKQYEPKMIEAIKADFGKSSYQTYLSELALVYSDLKLYKRKIGKWAKKNRVSTSLAGLPASTYTIKEPFGNSLIIGAWNYPFLLTLHPLVSAIAAGNVAIIKPSGTTPNCSAIMAEMINENFDSSYLYVVEGRGSVVDRIMDNPFNKIFFTGSPRVGKGIMKKAADYLANVSLELGGKSPCLFTEKGINDANIKRAVWGKYFNSGQTCIAPDYFLVPESEKQNFLDKVTQVIPEVIGDYKTSEFYCQISSERHLRRFDEMLEKDKEKLYYGGEVSYETRRLEPTVLHNVTLEDEVMKDEIFGPIMPVMTYKTIDEAIQIIKTFKSPLSFHYYIGSDSKLADRLIKEVPSGSGCVNDSVVFMAESKLPFGGVGNSGNSRYHGKYGFDTFSNEKGVLHRPSWFNIELPFKYAPYDSWKEKLVRKLL